jgi:primary-amine oxidase
MNFAHPCDPLSGEETAAAVAIVRQHGGLDASAWFETVALHEPDKAEVRRHTPDQSFSRKAFVCSYEPSSNRTFDGVVDLRTRTLERFQHVPGVQARIVSDEFYAAGIMVRKDAAFQVACAKRGIMDCNRVLIEPWAAGNFGIASEEGERIAYGHCWLMNDDDENPYGRPIGNLHPVIDLRRMCVLRVDDFGVVPLPPEQPKIVRTEGLRSDIKPLVITQPQGPSFTVEGHLVKWQKWHIRVGFNVREGLVLYDIGYEDKGKVRPIIYRASLAEMVVPYGDPTGGNFRRNAFDTGEYGVGALYDSLSLGCDCLGHIHYFDAWSHDWHGAPKKIENAICMHEEDFGLLWKFTNSLNGTTSRARSRRLVLSGISTIGNYVYGFFWYFYQDGTIGIEVKATGIPFPTNVAPDAVSEYGAIIAPSINSHAHQHVFSYRFDMAVDGDKNAVRETHFEGRPMGPGNPYGNAIIPVETALKRESDAQRALDLASQRYWKIVNTASHNKLGQVVGYKLVPGVNALPFLDPNAPIGRRAAFMYKHFWATQYKQDELYPCGWYPNQHAGGDGLPNWVKANRALENENVVVWYTMNYHHLSRPEDWPVQPVVYAGFHWMPEGFFDENPAMDVPPPEKDNKSCCC